MSEPSETYLGDGLYASYDDYQIRLRAPREFGDHVVYLDDHTFAAFLRFINNMTLWRIADDLRQA